MPVFSRSHARQGGFIGPPAPYLQVHPRSNNIPVILAEPLIKSIPKLSLLKL